MTTCKISTRIATLVWGLAWASYAQMVTPLHIGTVAPVQNEFGDIAEGNPDATGGFIQVLTAPTSVIHPPDLFGQPHPDNPPLAGVSSAMGSLTGRSALSAGLFGLSITNRPAEGTKLFVRVFNRPTIADSLYYGDSQIVTVNANRALAVEINGTFNLIDADRDTDGDGLPDWWKWIHFQNILEDAEGDFDLDGMNNRAEYLSGTNPADPLSALQIRPMDAPFLPALRWDTVPGKAYRIEFTYDSLNDEPVFNPILDVIVATNATTEVELPDGLIGPPHMFLRIRLVDTP